MIYLVMFSKIDKELEVVCEPIEETNLDHLVEGYTLYGYAMNEYYARLLAHEIADECLDEEE
jgi:hypothetical protein